MSINQISMVFVIVPVRLETKKYSFRSPFAISSSLESFVFFCGSLVDVHQHQLLMHASFLFFSSEDAGKHSDQRYDN